MARMALEGVRILDFTWVVAGPVATRILADQGAEVIKIERGDENAMSVLGPRRIGLQGELHRNKRSAAINMNHPRGVELARRLAAISDLVMDNFSARVMRGWGMDYQSLVKIKPDIVCISMSGLGHTGPRCNYVSYGPTLHALAGFTRLMTDARGEPAGYGYSYADMAGGYSGALAALIALWHRKRTGRGQFVDLSQFEALVSLVGPALLDISVNGRTQEAAGWHSQEAPAAPHGAYRCRPRGDDGDRWIVIAVRTQAEWERFAGAIGHPVWAADPRFRTLYLRMRNREELDTHVARWAANQEAEAAMALLQRAGVAAGVALNGADLCGDPHLAERGFFAPVKLPDGASTRLTGVPMRLSATPGSIRMVASEVGDDNDYILGELLGLGRAKRAELIAEGAVWG
ncbi:MAG TPA: CoA transferase [Candidatus Binataceae bacterium]|jgi:crotonobetainyl-CoA:carnitine CoA-transferase CaiB-like acyl-CoA transferase|nr:CoA transferase [Candidatus Binataceae bacterium]